MTTRMRGSASASQWTSRGRSPSELTYTEKSGLVTGRVTRGCDGEVMADLTFPLCSNSTYLLASLGTLHTGTYFVELTPEPGTKFEVLTNDQ
jgi:hypothetical protein